mmetsp:Transcript_5315/g.8221  ORF Transcript_5315/g.8221 Transcript_5315/m.8221 type:complete len:1096 (+) Transcript_5315:131-3418(+)|eukprot:CAMPEP_0184662692 /NCGR_PEP_ID=MMETSP0308-20130426/44469_1 /TAXON_ID=38269 /ORGANISM="Gloeochaete witrockiana, Strain SAG 46.84" /LENGTH=1095 /DNA_ID=CAMNT_0027104883 /DNA_START=97 /DNA_END=3384 /DNA_ORIENTATION=+
MSSVKSEWLRIKPLVELQELGVRPENISFGRCRLESSRYVSVIEAENPSGKQVAVVDIANNSGKRIPANTTDEAIICPCSPPVLIALRGKDPTTGFDVLQVCNFETPARIKTARLNFAIEYWKWVDDKEIALVSDTAVYVWSIEGTSDPVKIFDRNDQLKSARIMNYRRDGSGHWHVLVGLVQKADNPIEYGGLMQLYSGQHKKSRMVAGHAAAFSSLLTADGARKLVFCVAEGNGSIGKFHILELFSPESSKAGGTPLRKSVDLAFRVDQPGDFPVAVEMNVLGLVYIITKSGLCIVLEAETCAVLGTRQVSEETVFQTVQHETTGGVVFLNKPQVKNNQVKGGLIVSVFADPAALLSHAATRSQEAAIRIASREDTVWSRTFFTDQFERKLVANKFRDAAKLAANSPQGFLRTPGALAKVQECVQTDQNSPPLLQYLATLVEITRLSAAESVALAQFSVQKRNFDSIHDLLSRGKLECTKELGDMFDKADTALSASIHAAAQWASVVAPVVIDTPPNNRSGPGSFKENDTLALEVVLSLWNKFNIADRDRSGFLTRQEWEGMLANEVGSSKANNLGRYFDVFDVNKDGRIEFYEYVRTVAALKGEVQSSKSDARIMSWRDVRSADHFFHEIDRARTGSVAVSTVRAVVNALQGTPGGVTTEEAKKFLEVLDGLPDGKATFEALLTAVASGVVHLPSFKGTSKRPPSPGTDSVPSLAVPRQSSLSEKDKQRAFRAFLKYDKDGSGAINKDELGDLLRSLYPNISLPEINRMYMQMDQDNSGQITFDEFLLGVSSFNIDLSRLNLESVAKKPVATKYEWEVPYEQLVLGKKLGEGSFGIVWKGSWHGTTVAIKKLKFEKAAMPPDVLEDFRKEVAILGRLRHPNVLLFMGACTESPNYCMVTEFLEGGSLFDLMHDKHLKLNLDTVLSMSIQAARGLSYLHNCNPPVIHRDLKSLNLLVDAYGNVKLADFGLSCIKDKKTVKEQVGTPIFMAPELLQNQAYTEKVDIYSFSICVWEMLTGKIPFDTLDYDGLVKAVVNQQARPPMPRNIPSALADLLSACWAQDPAKRPSIGAVLQRLEKIHNSHKSSEPSIGGI